MPVIFQEKLDKTLNFRTPVWQDDIIIVTRGSAEEHYEEVAEVLNNLEENGYRASLEKSKFFQKSATWCGFDIDENGSRPKHNRVEAVLKIEPPPYAKGSTVIFRSGSIFGEVYPKSLRKDAAY